jgi:hypothetical protein
MLNGSEPPALVRVFASVLNYFAEQITGLATSDEAIKTAMPPAPDAAEAPKATKSVAKRQKAQAETPAPQTESAETATADQSAVIAQALKAGPDGADAPDVKIEDIRAIARKFNTDETRAIAVGILAKHGAKSVTELAERDNIVRVSALNDFTAALETI